MVRAHCCAPYPNDYVYDMRPTCVVHVVWYHFIPEPSTSFFQVPWSVLVTMPSTLWLMWQCDWSTLTWVVLKIEDKKKKKSKIKWNKKNKIQSTVNDLDSPRHLRYISYLMQNSQSWIYSSRISVLNEYTLLSLL